MEPRIAFAGTPVFGAWVLRDLVQQGRVPDLVISQPNRPAGRGRKVTIPPVAVEAGLAELPCIQPEDVNAEHVRDRLLEEGVEILVVAAFGQLLAPGLLERFLCINVHAALLPKHRGAAPITRAVQVGEDETGVSIMRMTEGLDEGPVALYRRISIGLRDDAGSIGRVLALLGAQGVGQVVTGTEEGTVEWRPQEGTPSYARKVRSEDRVLDPERDAREVHDMVRALAPESGLRAEAGDLSLKVYRTWPLGETGEGRLPEMVRFMDGNPGLLATEGEQVFMGCGRGAVRLLEIQPAGRRVMRGSEFVRGYGKRLVGARMGPSGR